MIDIYVLNKNLEQIGIIDYYTSLIWATRYNDIGDCELYVEANEKAIELLKEGNYLIRLDDDMVCRIENIRIETNTENGNYIIVTGYDVKKILDQRIIWSQTSIDGSVEKYIRSIVNDNLINPTLEARKIKDLTGRANFFLNNEKGFSEVISEQTTYKKVGEKIREICKKYEWGHRIYVENQSFIFDLYKGTDRTSSVIFSSEFENLISTLYEENSSNIANVALIGGEGEGAKRSTNISGYAESIERNEIFVDAKDVSKTITWGDLISTYPTLEQGRKWLY